MIKTEIAGIVTAFDEYVIGTKVCNAREFMNVLTTAITEHDFSADNIIGQAYIELPDAKKYVSGGVGVCTSNPKDYTLAEHRGMVKSYLKREHAEETKHLAVVVYTKDAYLTDPDIDEDPNEADRIKASGATHVLVAVLSSAGDPAPHSPTRFVWNLAGGNHEALEWSADEIREKSQEIKKYYTQWCSVADV